MLKYRGGTWQQVPGPSPEYLAGRRVDSSSSDTGWFMGLIRIALAGFLFWAWWHWR